MDRGTEGAMAGQTEGWREGVMDGRTDRRAEGQTDGWREGRTDGRTDRRTEARGADAPAPAGGPPLRPAAGPPAVPEGRLRPAHGGQPAGDTRGGVRVSRLRPRPSLHVCAFPTHVHSMSVPCTRVYSRAQTHVHPLHV